MIPFALRGVRVRAEDATAQLTRNIVIFGIGDLITPFVLIKLIDLLTVGQLETVREGRMEQNTGQDRESA